MCRLIDQETGSSFIHDSRLIEGYGFFLPLFLHSLGMSWGGGL